MAITTKHKRLTSVYLVPIDLIEREASPAPDKGFIEDIRENGVENPVLLIEGSNGKYKIVYGRRRTFGAFLAGLTEVPAIIKESVPNINASILRENLHRSQNIGIELKALQELIRKGNMDIGEIAAMLHINAARLKRIYRIANLSSRWLKHLCSGLITEAKALHLARLPKDKQDYLLEEYGVKVDPKAIQAVVRNYKIEGAQTILSGTEDLPQLSVAQRKLEELASMISAGGQADESVNTAISVLRNHVNLHMSGSPVLSEGGISHGGNKINSAAGLWQ